MKLLWGCIVKSLTQAISIVWYKGSVLVDASADDDITISENYVSSTYTSTGVLTIANFDSDDTADYKCEASLSGGLTVISYAISIDLSSKNQFCFFDSLHN